MAGAKVFVFTAVDETGKSHREMEAAGCTLSLGDPSWRAKGATREQVLALGAGSQAWIGGIMRGVAVNGGLLDEFPDLRIIAKYSIGVDDIDLKAATERGILVTHSPTEANWGGVAEGTMAMILALLKRVRERDRHVKEGKWREDSMLNTYVGRRQDGYQGLTVGIVGLGRIGSRLADLFGPWRVRLIACDPYVDESKFAHHNCEQVDLETLLKDSDVVTLHCDLTDETTRLINEARLDLMKPTAILVNAARGPMVDPDALFFALEKDKIAGAALDVFDKEPPDPQSPLLGLGDKILCSPHMVSATKGGSLEPAIPWATKAVLDALRGEVPRHVFNEEVIPDWKARFGGKSLI